MRRLPTAAKIYIWGVIVSGAATLLLISLEVGTAQPSSILLSLFCSLALLLSETHQIPVSDKINITISTAVIFPAILLMSPALACWAVALGMGFAYVYLGREWFKVTFNTAACVLAVASTGLTYQVVSGGETALLASWENAASLCLAAMVYIIANSGLVAGVVALSEMLGISGWVCLSKLHHKTLPSSRWEF